MEPLKATFVGSAACMTTGGGVPMPPTSWTKKCTLLDRVSLSVLRPRAQKKAGASSLIWTLGAGALWAGGLVVVWLAAESNNSV